MSAAAQAIYAMCYFYYESYKFIKAAEMKRGSGGGGDNKVRCAVCGEVGGTAG